MTERTPGPSGDSFLPGEWAELVPLVDAVLDAPAENRAALIARLSGGDDKRRRALEQLVDECELDTPLLNRPAAERFDQLVREEDAGTLPEMLGDRYRTGREVGRGGMARVYIARDVKHDRDVAVKVIRSELAASLGRDRFLREIAIAARLRHPNILPLFDSGDANGSLYFVMPFEAGPSLRERLTREGPLPIADAISVLRDVARALQYAHEQGVAHRDIKPDNVLMSGGAAVVTDFGIAKAVSAAQTFAPKDTMTQAGAGIGTPAYMAPEQAVGDPTTDHRADIYSFGCLAYELFSGQAPFHGLSPHEVIAAHLGTPPRPLEERRTDVPETVSLLVSRCLEKSPSARPQTAAELIELMQLPGTAALPRPRRRRTKETIAIATIVGAVALGGFAWMKWKNGSVAAPITVSVLPTVNIEGDSSLELFADGLSDEIATALARVPGIQIQSRSGARLYRGQLGIDVTEAGLRLNAAFVVTGAMRSIAGQWKISAELTRTSDAAELWSQTFDRSPAERIGAASDIAAAITTALRARFPRSLGAVVPPTDHQRTSSAEAYRLFFLGQELLRRRGLSVKESADHFRRAIAEDSLFAPAYSGLAMSLALFPYFHFVPWKEVSNEVVRTARRALELDSTLAQPHVALGLVHQFAYRWDSAGREYRAAIALDSRDVEARVQYARHLLFRGRTLDAMRELQVAKGADPASALVLSWLSYAYYLDGRLDSALMESRRALENDSQNFTTNSLGAFVLIANNRPDEAMALANRLPSENGLRLSLQARVGDRAQLMQILDRLVNDPTPNAQLHTTMAFAYLGLGDTAQALAALEAATDDGEIWHNLQPVSELTFDSIRESPRFVALLQRVGLPEMATVRRVAPRR